MMRSCRKCPPVCPAMPPSGGDFGAKESAARRGGGERARGRPACTRPDNKLNALAASQASLTYRTADTDHSARLGLSQLFEMFERISQPKLFS